MTAPTEQQQVQYMAVPIQLMGVAVKILSTLPYDQVSGIIPQLTACQQLGSVQETPAPPPEDPPTE